MELKKVSYDQMEKAYSNKKTNIATTVNTAVTGNSFSSETISYTLHMSNLMNKYIQNNAL